VVKSDEAGLVGLTFWTYDNLIPLPSDRRLPAVYATATERGEQDQPTRRLSTNQLSSPHLVFTRCHRPALRHAGYPPKTRLAPDRRERPELAKRDNSPSHADVVREAAAVGSKVQALP
jgi:hypothetical protein